MRTPLVRALLAASVGAAFVIAAALLWPAIERRSTVYTDGEAIKRPVDGARERASLWTPPVALPPAINAQGDDVYEPRLSWDGDTLYFVRRRAGENADIYVAERTPNGWSEPVPLARINTPDADELGPAPTADGQAFYFYSNRANGQGGYDLWVSRRGAKGWLEPVNLGPRVNTPYNEYSPAIDEKRDRLFFASNRPWANEVEAAVEDAWPATIRERRAPRADYDLYAARFLSDTELDLIGPVSLLNTDQDEGSPEVSPAGDFLYFASDRAGEGGYDLFRARLIDETLGDVEPLGDDVNTPANELDPALGALGYELLFSSDRIAAGGAVDPETPYALYRSESREVYQQWTASEASIDWMALLPWLLALIALLLLLLLALLLLRRLERSGALRRLSTLAKCILASLLAHALLALLFTVWHVATEIGDAWDRSGGTQVRLTSAAAGRADLERQIRAGLTDLAVTPPPPLAMTASRPAVDAPFTSAPAPALEAARPASEAMVQRVEPNASEPMKQPPREVVVRAEAPDANAVEPSTPAVETPAAQTEATLAVDAPRAQASPTSQAIEAHAAFGSAVHFERSLIDARDSTISELAASAAAAPDIARRALEPETPTLARAALVEALPTADAPASAAEEPSVRIKRVETASYAPSTPAVSADAATSTALERTTVDAAPAISDFEAPPASAPNASRSDPRLTSPDSLPAMASIDAPAPTESAVETGASEPAVQVTAASPSVLQATPGIDVAPTERAALGRTKAPPLRMESALIADASAPTPDARTPEAVTPELAHAAALDAALPTDALREPASEDEPALAIQSRSDPIDPRAELALDMRVSEHAHEQAALAPAEIAALPIPSERAIDAAPSAVETPDFEHDVSLPLREQTLAQAEFAPAIPLETEPPLADPPAPQPQRAEASRQALVERFGGSEETERAVAQALAWLARHQSANGRWDSDGFDPTARQSGASRVECDVAVTGLALLCFLGADHTHAVDGPYRHVVQDGIEWLLAQQDDAGDLRAGETLYSHSIATIALAEALGMTGDESLRRPVERAVAFLAGARNARRGGWRYEPGMVGDTSVLGWVVMALKSAERAGVPVPTDSFGAAQAWLTLVDRDDAPGLYAYQPGMPPTASMTAEAMFVSQLLEIEDADGRRERATSFLLRRGPDRRRPNTYYWYYATLALFQQGGEAWEEWNDRVARILVESQREDGPASGSWDPEDRWSVIGGRVYQTAVCTLTLEVYYRYLPTYLQDADPLANPAARGQLGTE